MAADLSAEIWALIALIAGLTVTMCLAVLASMHGRLMKVRKLGEDVQSLRRAYGAAFRSVQVPDGAQVAPPAEGAGDEDTFLVV
jgi:hypothetical protein